MIEILVDILYTLRRWRAFAAWILTASIVYPVLHYDFPTHAISIYLAVAIGVTGFFGGLYWEAQPD